MCSNYFMARNHVIDKRRHVFDDIDYLNLDSSHSNEFQKIEYLNKVLVVGKSLADATTGLADSNAEYIKWLLGIFYGFTAEDISLLTEKDIYDILATKPNSSVKSGTTVNRKDLRTLNACNKKTDEIRCKTKLTALLSALQRAIERDEIIYGNSFNHDINNSPTQYTNNNNYNIFNDHHHNSGTADNIDVRIHNHNLNMWSNDNHSTNARASRRFSILMSNNSSNTQTRYEEQEYIRLKAEIPSFLSNKLNLLGGKMTSQIDMAVCRGDFDSAFELLKTEIALLESHLQINSSAEQFKASDDLELFLTRLQQSQLAVEVDESDWWLRNVLSSLSSQQQKSSPSAVISRVVTSPTEIQQPSLSSTVSATVTSPASTINSNKNTTTERSISNNISSDIGVSIDYYHALYPYPLSDDDEDDNSENDGEDTDDNDDEEELQYGTINTASATAVTESSGTTDYSSISNSNGNTLDNILSSARRSMLNTTSNINNNNTSSGSNNNTSRLNSSRSSSNITCSTSRIVNSSSSSTPPLDSSRNSPHQQQQSVKHKSRSNKSENTMISARQHNDNETNGATKIKDKFLFHNLGNSNSSTVSTVTESSSDATSEFSDIANKTKENINRQMIKFTHQTHKRMNQLKQTYYQDNSFFYQQEFVQKRDLFQQKMDQNLDIYLTKMNANIKKVHDQQMNILNKTREDADNNGYSYNIN